MMTALAAGQAAAQTPAPAPPPVPLAAPPATTAEPAIPIYERTTAMPAMRVPSSFVNSYANTNGTTGYVNPGDLRRGGPICGPQGCSQEAGCNACGVCGPAGRIWGEFDYIYWIASGDRVPALVTASPAGTPVGQAGVIGSPGATVLVGNSPLGDDARSGLRYNVGVWLNEEQTFGLQTGGFFLSDVSTSTALSSNGDLILSRPFQNALNGLQASQLVAFPGTLAGSVGVDHQNSVNGFDVALRGNMCCGPRYRLDALLGYRYLRIEDDLTINENLVAGVNAPANLGVVTGTNIRVNDSFATSNSFNGVQVGMAGEFRFAERWYLSGVTKASLGWINQSADILGATSVAVPGQAVVQNTGGLLALSSNIGHSSQTQAIIIPELNLNLGFQVTQNVRLRAGYSFLYVSSVVRPGTVIDTTVNPGLIPPPVGSGLPARPAPLFDRTDFILHGINAGLEVRF